MFVQTETYEDRLAARLADEGFERSFETREQWLQAFTEAARPRFAELGHPLPAKVRMAVGFTSGGKRGKAIGECWYSEASSDQSVEIFITPSIADSTRVADILTHELCHAALGKGFGHGKVFGKLARALGLTGKLTATVAGPDWHAWADPILADLGPIPHAALNAAKATTEKKEQKNRMIKVECDTCGFVFRAARSWIEKAENGLRCPDHECEGMAHPS